LAIADFHRDGGNYRFINTFPDVVGDQPQITPKFLVKGTTVQFLPGKARFSMAVLGPNDPACCPTGRASYTVTLNPAPGARRRKISTRHVDVLIHLMCPRNRLTSGVTALSREPNFFSSTR
jgi:hypothetical protein